MASESVNKQSVSSEHDGYAEQIIVECSDGKEFEIPLEIAMMSPRVVEMLNNNQFVEEDSVSSVIYPPLPTRYKKIVLNDVPSLGLSRVLEYCKYHEQCMGTSVREKDLWDAEFLDQGDVYSICVLAKAAYHLDVKPLIDLTSRELASRLMTLTSEEMMEVFDKKQEKDLLPLQDKNPPVFLRQANIFRRDFGLTGGPTAVIEQAYDLIICDRLDQIKPKATKQKAKEVYEALIKRQEHLGITTEELGREVGSIRMSTASDAADDSLPNGFVTTRDGKVFVDPQSGLKKATINATENNMMLQKSKDNVSNLNDQHTSDSVKSGQARGSYGADSDMQGSSKVHEGGTTQQAGAGKEEKKSCAQGQHGTAEDDIIKNLHSKSVDDILDFLGEDTSNQGSTKKLSKRAKKRLRQKEKQRQQKEEQLRVAKEKEDAKLLALEHKKKKEEIKKMLRSGSTDLTDLKVEDIFDESQFDDEDVEADGDDEIAAFAARLEESFVSLTPKVNRKKVKINTKDIFSL